MRRDPIIAIVGATGLVGSEMAVVCEELRLPFKQLRLFASEESAGEVYSVRGEEVVVELLKPGVFEGVDIALFGTQAELSRQFVPLAVEAGAFAIDNSSEFRLHEGVPLVVPEVNPETITAHDKIIANPNCSTIQLVPVLAAIHEAAGLKRVVVSTYQSVSGAGKGALDELWEQSIAVFNQQELSIVMFPVQIAFNCIPQVDLVLEDGYTKEELKMVRETRKILALPELRITTTCVRVPVLCSHAESVNVETVKDLAPQDLINILSRLESLEVYPDPSQYPTQIHVTGTDKIHVGRIRRDTTVEHGLNLWIVADNVRKGAALNAVQIAKVLISRFTDA